MTEVLSVIIAFLVFMVILKSGSLGAIRPASLVIYIIIALVVGSVVASLLGWLFSSAIKILIPLVIIGIIILIFKG